MLKKIWRNTSCVQSILKRPKFFGLDLFKILEKALLRSKISSSYSRLFLGACVTMADSNIQILEVYVVREFFL